MSDTLLDRRGIDPGLAVTDLNALGVGVRLVVSDQGSLAAATSILRAELEAIDLACSRFRADSELVMLNAAAGATVHVSPLLAQAIGVGLSAARDSGGDVDPTLGSSLVRLGYDRDFGQLPADGDQVAVTVWRGSGWQQVHLDVEAGTVRVPAGVQLDLGATAKAWCADNAAARIHTELGVGALVSLGGDIAVAGRAPANGWPIRVQDHPGLPTGATEGPTATVSIRSGGLATSSTAARRWRRGGQTWHHLLDPRTGMPARSRWRTVSVCAPTCLWANVATTAAIVRADGAVAGLQRAGLPARLVSTTGEVTCLNGWPLEVDDGHR